MKRFKLIDYRKRLGLTQTEMATKLGVSKSHWAAVEIGAQNPSYSLMERFSQEFEGVSWDLFAKEVAM